MPDASARQRDCRVLLLTPSNGLGGGIERYDETVQWVLVAQRVACPRVDLAGPGPRGHLRMLAEARALLHVGPLPVRLVVAHRSLLPAAASPSHDPAVCGVSVVCHGCAPVIAPAHGGSSGAYLEGVTGAALADETAQALVGVLREMLDDPARLAWMSKRSAEWARESFAPAHYAQLVTRRLL